MLSKINPTSVEALMMRLEAIEMTQNTVMGEIAAFETDLEMTLESANAELSNIEDNVLPSVQGMAEANTQSIADLMTDVEATTLSLGDFTLAADTLAEDVAKL